MLVVFATGRYAVEARSVHGNKAKPHRRDTLARTTNPIRKKRHTPMIGRNPAL